MYVTLKHYSFVKGSEGGPGEVVEVADELGRKWLEENAAEEAAAPPKPKAKASKATKKPKSEKADAIKEAKQARQTRETD